MSARRAPPERVTERTSAEPAAAPSGPIYIGGLDRSGKTTMRAFLSSHPNIAIPAVGSNMWTYFYGQFGDLGNRSNFERCLQAMIRYKHVRHLDPDPERIRREFAEGPPTYARLFALFLIHYSQRLGKPRWGDQTGLIERYADQLFAANPRARVIHMVRDPRDRYEASLDLWPSGRGRAGGATARWKYSITLGDRNVRRYPHGYRIVRYEDMVLRPEATIREVCAFLGETFYPEMLTMSGALKHRSLLMNGSPRGGTEGPLSAEFIGRHRGRIPSAELAFMQLHAHRMMLRYGYRLEPVDLGWTGWARFALLDWPNQLLRMAGWRGREALHQRFPGSFGRKPGHRMILPPIDPPDRVTR